MKDLTACELVGRRLWLILLLFNMLACAYSRHVGWVLFWAIAFSSYAYDTAANMERPKNGLQAGAITIAV